MEPETEEGVNGGSVVKTDKDTDLEKVEATKTTRFKTMKAQGSDNAWAMKQFMLLDPDWSECVDAALSSKCKPSEFFEQWILRQRDINGDDTWLPNFDEFAQMLQEVKDRGGKILLTYRSWVKAQWRRNYYWGPSQEQLSKIAEIGGYNSKWVGREISEFKRKGKRIAA